MTDYSSLQQLINRYNRIVSQTLPDVCVEDWVVELRDALAHGRVASSHPEPPFHLLKFARPTGSSVTVTYNVAMTSEWLSEQIRGVHDQVRKVASANEAFYGAA